MRERIDEGSGERRSSRVGGQFSIRSGIRDTQSRQTHMYFDYYGSNAHVYRVRTKQFRSATPGRVP